MGRLLFLCQTFLSASSNYECFDISVFQTFRVYETGKEGPVCFFLHGGGFSALSWAVLSVSKANFCDLILQYPTFYSQKDLVHILACRCVAMDFRGHGDTYTKNDTDLSSATLAECVQYIFSYSSFSPKIVITYSLNIL